jgi:hypothetical protein
VDDVYLTLSASEVDNLFFWYVIMREPTQDFERNFAKWATELRSIKSDEELDAFIVARFDKAKADLVNRFDDSMGRLALRSLQLYRFQYVLAKLTQQVDLLAYGETEGTRWLGNYVSGGYEVEHIFPQPPGAEAAAEFGPVSDHLSRSLALSGAFLNTVVRSVESGGAWKLKTSLISFAENRNANLRIRRGGWP